MTSNWCHRASKMQLCGVKRRFARSMNCMKMKIFALRTAPQPANTPADCSKQAAQLSPKAAPLALCLQRTKNANQPGFYVEPEIEINQASSDAARRTTKRRPCADGVHVAPIAPLKRGSGGLRGQGEISSPIRDHKKREALASLFLWSQKRLSRSLPYIFLYQVLVSLIRENY